LTDIDIQRLMWRFDPIRRLLRVVTLRVEWEIQWSCIDQADKTIENGESRIREKESRAGKNINSND
jgi:hypothetical protein